MRFESADTAITFDDVLIVPKHSTIASRSSGLKLRREYNPLGLELPFISANMDTITGEKMIHNMADIGCCGILHRNMPVTETESIIRKWTDRRSDKIFCSVGVIRNQEEKSRIDSILGSVPTKTIICVDIAHGDSQNMLDTIKYIRDKGFAGKIIAGNVCTPEAVDTLDYAGASVAKVGIGGGSVCTTRIQTGCGYPQLAAIMECSDAGIPIIADGGIRTPGDACKALAAGAHYVMLGGMLAGTDWAEEKGVYRGMASNEAQGGNAAFVEGISVNLNNRGSTFSVIKGLEAGILSCMSYVGAKDLEELTEKAIFVRVSNNAAQEAKPHFKE